MGMHLRPAAGCLALALLATGAGAAGAQTPVPTATTPMTPAPVMTPAHVMTPAPAMTAAPSPSASPSPTATPAPENPLVTARVRQEFDAWQRGRIDRKTYSPAAGGTYDDAVIAVVKPDLAEIGPLQGVQYQTASLLLGDLVYRYSATGSNGSVSILLLLDQRGRTDSIVFTPLIFRSTSTP